jgi:hypothetical protein
MSDANFPELHESHEAGHVIAAALLGIHYTYVTVAEVKRADGSVSNPHVWIDSPLLDPVSGAVQTPIPHEYKDLVWPLAIFSLAGITASIANTPGDRAPFMAAPFRALGENDINIIRDLFQAHLPPDERYDSLIVDTVELVYRHWAKSTL